MLQGGLPHSAIRMDGALPFQVSGPTAVSWNLKPPTSTATCAIDPRVTIWISSPTVSSCSPWLYGSLQASCMLKAILISDTGGTPKLRWSNCVQHLYTLAISGHTASQCSVMPLTRFKLTGKSKSGRQPLAVATECPPLVCRECTRRQPLMTQAPWEDVARSCPADLK